MSNLTDQPVQHRGHCQCCLREQAVTNGHMAKHGYTVEDHWFKGGCYEYNAPLEQDHSVADRIIQEIQAKVDEKRKLHADLQSGKVVPQFVTRSTFREAVEVPYSEALSHEQRDALHTAIFRAQRDVEHGERLIQDFEEAIKMYFGRPLMEVRKNPPPERILAGETRVSQRRGVIHAKRVDGGRVHWEDERGYGSKMSTREWRLLPKQEAEEELSLPNEAAAQDEAAAEGELNQLSHSHLRRDG
ncbi:hypothetical protein [Acidithiobacillus albertensis]|uniref:hypothetical protein n=1 Tax=Acidithiobacillus albertensis TaxID=119978 RepID=UPI001C075735|nr:hypothetical protein [Acidithiobacillus albertensis]MBU2741875.1 hypothetical protein [Acidithiobacillus albertensis]